MKFNKLGNTDLEVSLICLGSMTWGQQNNEADAHAQLDYALSRGINFIDTAEMYPVPPTKDTQGLTESYIGTWLNKRGKRDDIILASKLAGPADWLSHIRGGPRLTADQINQAIETSLARLQTDYLDLYQLHWPDRHTNYFGQLGYEENNQEQQTPLDESIKALDDLIKAGKIRHWGFSNETPWGVMKALAICERDGFAKPVSIQNPYNLLNRSYEVGMAEISHRESVGLLAYSPLGFGMLTGKYIDRQPEKARLTLFDRFTRYTNPESVQATKEYSEVAKRFGLSQTEMALAFVNNQSFVTSNIIGATTMEQLKENIDSIDTVLTEDVLKAISGVHQMHPNPAP